MLVSGLRGEANSVQVEVEHQGIADKINGWLLIRHEHQGDKGNHEREYNVH